MTYNTRSKLLFSGMLFATLGSSTITYSAEPPARWTPGLMAQCKRVGGTAISPDGKSVAYTVSEAMMEGEKSEYLSQVWVAASDGRTNRQFTRGEKSCTSPAFAPDGKHLSFLSSRGADGKSQVWILPLDGGDAGQITMAKSGVSAYAWSPDGKRIAYTSSDPETPEEEKSRKEKRDMALVDANHKYAHLYTTTVSEDATGGRPVRRLTSGAFHVTGFDWSPDGKTLAFSHQATPSLDIWMTLDISTVPADSGEVRLLATGKGLDSFPFFSPDGKWLAFLSDSGDPHWARALDVYIMPAQGGAAKLLGTDPECIPQQIAGWSAESDAVYILAANRSSRRVYALPVSGAKPRIITTGPGENTDPSLSRNGRALAWVRQETETPPDVYLASPVSGNPVKLTDVHSDFPNLPMGKTEVITWKSKDGLEIEGLLTWPVGYEKGKRYPLILNIHGGPASFFTQAFTGAGSFYPVQSFAQDGYAYLQPNPRGSAGYGKKFLFANYNDWGFGDYEDLMSGVDAVIALGVAHPDSLCVMGASYGGYMTSMIVTKTKRFKAASNYAGVTNLMSFTGTSDITTFLPDYFGGDYWDRMDTYMKHSAMFNIKGVATPTQILHGREDVRVPLSQSMELYNALKRQNCPT
ncbi:MAG: S9 family peptidase, partial [Candidatus Latescibacterota bacterium]